MGSDERNTSQLASGLFCKLVEEMVVEGLGVARIRTVSHPSHARQVVLFGLGAEGKMGLLHTRCILDVYSSQGLRGLSLFGLSPCFITGGHKLPKLTQQTPRTHRHKAGL